MRLTAATAAGNVAAFPGTLATVPAAGTALGRPGNTYAGYQVGDPADVQGVILKAITPVGQTGQARQD